MLTLPDGHDRRCRWRRAVTTSSGHAVRAQPVGIDADDDGALAAAERRRARHAREGREQRPDPVQRQVLDLAEARRVSLEKTR